MNLTLFRKQEEFFHLDNKINIFSGGIQSSKTTTGAMRFLMKGLLAHRAKDDNFIVAADVYKTLHQATIPTFKKFCGQYGKMNEGKAEFKTHWGSTVYFRTGKIPDSAEGIPRVRRVWLDEGGKVSRYFWENLEGRAAPLAVPIDVTTTPYAMNWLAKMVKDARRGLRKDVSIVHCKSLESPYFSKDEYYRQKGLLDPVRFRMKYDGEFGQMEGLVFPLYEECLIPSKPLVNPTYYAGIDWGYYPDPFCLVIRAVDENGIHYRVSEFYKNHMIMDDIVHYVLSVNGLYHFKQIFCDPSQPAAIEALCAKKLPAMGAKNDIRAGIDAHYALMKSHRFFIFQEMNPFGEDEYSTYHYREERELGIDDDLREKDTLPVDQNNHGIDADRYLSIMLEEFAGDKILPKAPEMPVPLARLEQSRRIAMLKRKSKYNGTPYD
jgi:PBSX family phage terminase large subunit